MSATDKLKLDNMNVAYGVCETAGATAQKVVTLVGNTEWKLEEGALIMVKFAESNTAENVTLKVGNSNAYPIWYNVEEYTGTSSAYCGYADRTITYAFNGTHWIWISSSYDANNDTKVQQNAATTSNVNYPVLLGYNSSTAKVTNTVNKASTLKYNPSTQTLTVPKISGALTGNASTATAFSAAKSITLEGDVNGTSSSTGGWLIPTTLSNTGVTAGSYGLASAVTPAFGASFNVPHITVDAKGRITSASTYTVKLPANPNTDTGATSVAFSGSGNALTGVSYNASTRTLTFTKSTYNNYTYTLPLATSSVRGGVKIGYSQNGKNYPVQLSNEQMFVNVPWTDNNTTYSVFGKATSTAAGTEGLVPAPAAGSQAKFLRGDGTWATPTNTTYTAGTGLSLSGTKFNHTNSISAKTAYAQSSTASPGYGGSFKVYEPKYDAQGHITGVQSETITMPSAQSLPTSFNITANGEGDGIILLSKSGGANSVTYNVSHERLWQSPDDTGGTIRYTSGNNTSSISGVGGSGTIKIPQISVDDYGHVRYGSDESVTITIPSAMKNPYKLTMGSKTYDGSSNVTLTAADLGLSGAMRFIGSTSTEITDGGTQTPTINNSSVALANLQAGNVVLYGAKEFVWNGSSWELLGDEGSYSIKGHTHTASYTPAGTVTTPTFTGTSATSGAPSGTTTVASSTHTHNYTPAGTVGATFTGTQGTVSTSYTPAGTLNAPAFTGTAGTTTSISGTSTVYQITGTGTLPTLTASVSNRCLTLTFAQGTLPTRASVNVALSSHTHGYTPSGTVAAPTFTGTKATISAAFTPAGTVAATFSGTAASTTSISGTTKVGSSNHTHSVVAKGSIGSLTFTGTTATITTNGSAN